MTHSRTGILYLSIALVAGCGSPREAPPTSTQAAAPVWAGMVTYGLGPDVGKLYPNATWLPEKYQKDYPSIGGAVQKFTEASLQRDGISYTSVTAADNGTVTLTGSDPRLERFAQMHTAFVAPALLGLNGVNLCKATPGEKTPTEKKEKCWDPSWDFPHRNPHQLPWAFFLPLGLPMVNQQAVTFLDYPPATSLQDGDYLENETMKRWTRVLAAVGVANPVLFETIVDARPIAAPGTGQETYLPDPKTFFNTPPDRSYLTPMLALLANPPTNASLTNSLPIQVLGGPAQIAWASIVGQKTVQTLDVGTTTLPGATKATSWVAGNHPNVTSYNCCPGDTSEACRDKRVAPPLPPQFSSSLIADEQIDLQVACTIMTLAQDQSLSPATAAQRCSAQWGGDPAKLAPAEARTLCVQAQLDYRNFPATCTLQQAEAYCTAHANNACFNLTPCSDLSKATPKQ